MSWHHSIFVASVSSVPPDRCNSGLERFSVRNFPMFDFFNSFGSGSGTSAKCCTRQVKHCTSLSQTSGQLANEDDRRNFQRRLCRKILASVGIRSLDLPTQMRRVFVIVHPCDFFLHPSDHLSELIGSCYLEQLDATVGNPVRLWTWLYLKHLQPIKQRRTASITVGFFKSLVFF